MVAIRSLATILTYVIGLCGIMPLFPWLTPFPRAILVVGVLAGLWQDRRKRWSLHPWMQNLLIVPVFVHYALQFSRVNPIHPVISILAIMLAVRFSGEKSVRHSLQIYALSMFCLASSSLFDLSPIFLIYLGLLLCTIAIALVLLTFQNQDSSMMVSRPDLKRILISGFLMPALAVPLLLFFFPLMPRTQIPLWNFLNQGSLRTTGYSDTVEPGSQSSVTDSRSRVFRAEMPQISLSQLYWRATVFNRTDGTKWSRSPQIPSEQLAGMTGKVSQSIFPEPSAVRTLIALDRPVSLDLQRVNRSSDGVFELTGMIGRRVSYRADSQTGGVVIQRNPINRRHYLQLPDRLPSRIQDLASAIVRNGINDRERVTYLENYFRNGGYRYSTKDLVTGDRAVERFLFEKKQGHCEFFASSFALLLRAAGVPCRLVGGYLGGEYNRSGGYYLVSEDKAHVWVEAYIEGNGWVRIDPSTLATNAGDVWKAPESPTLMRRISQTIDSLNHLWSRSVVTYDFEQQITIARSIGSRLQVLSLGEIMRRSMPYAAAMLLFAGLLFVSKKTALFHSREQRILNRFLHIVEREWDISARQGGLGLFEIASIVDHCLVTEFVAIYAEAVYRDRKLTDSEYLQLQQILSALSVRKSKKP